MKAAGSAGWWVLLFVLFSATLVAAQPTDWFQSSVVTAELNVSSSIDIEPRGPNPLVQFLRADVIFVPQNSDFVAVRRFETVPRAKVTGDRARFEWSNPGVGTVDYRYSAVVESANNVPRVRAKIPFPIDPPEGFERYLASTQHIDARSPAVGQMARELAAGEDDLFVVVSTVASWVKNNIQYNLSTLTADVSQPASWVLQNRYGVCDELTSVFIAMLRSLDIPARFVSGLAFTNNPAFPGGWGAHGWAEVYFPGVGWVPYDPTFGELAWIDPGHIKLKESLDPQEPTTVFEWKSREVGVEVHDLELSASVLETKGVVPFELAMAVSPLKSRVGFGSYNGIVVEVENRADYYVAAELTLTQVRDMEIIGGEDRQVALPPGGRERVFWVVKVREDLDPSFQYELPIRVYTIRNDTAEASFAVGRSDVVFSEEEILSSVDQLTVSVEDPFELACAFENDFVWEDAGRLNCVVQNNEDEERPVNVCFGECRPVLLPPSGSVPVSFEVPAPAPGPHEARVTVADGPVEKKAVLTVVRLDEPRIAIRDIDAPETVAYGDAFAVSFMLTRESVSFPQNVTVTVKGGGAKAVIDVGELTVDQAVTVNVKSAELYSASPTFSIEADFKDTLGRGYSVERGAPVRVSGVPWWKKVIGFFIDWF